MGLVTSGVSGGVPLIGQVSTSGIVLSSPGDFALIQPNNGSPPVGPDISGFFSLFGNYTNAILNVNYVVNPIQYFGGLSSPPAGVYVGQNAQWQFFPGTTRQDTGTFITGPFSPSNNAALQITLGSVISIFAIQLVLVSLGSGSMTVTGSTSPSALAGVDIAILAAVNANATYNKGQLLALCDMNNTTAYADAYGIQL
jgi:hypothetical protein